MNIFFKFHPISHDQYSAMIGITKEEPSALRSFFESLKLIELRANPTVIDDDYIVRDILGRLVD